MLESELLGDVLHLKLARPPVNALNRALLSQLREAIVSAPAQGASGLVISGGDKVFSAGLDVPELLTLDVDSLRASWLEFFGVCEALARSPLPSVAAITGHSPAGGAVIALHCDYRVMVSGPAKIGLNETQVGLAVPECVQYALSRLVGRHRAERMLVAGAMIDSATAQQYGLVDELAEPGQVVEQSLAWLRGTLALPRQAMLHTRAIARDDLVQAVSDPNRLDLDRFLDDWMGEETQTVLKGLVARLKGG